MTNLCKEPCLLFKILPAAENLDLFKFFDTAIIETSKYNNSKSVSMEKMGEKFAENVQSAGILNSDMT